jgi:hypothetical protein
MTMKIQCVYSVRADSYKILIDRYLLYVCIRTNTDYLIYEHPLYIRGVFTGNRTNERYVGNTFSALKIHVFVVFTAKC